MSNEIITQKRLKELLHYEPTTGLFTWYAGRKGTKVGSIAGTKSNGYTTICVDGKRHQAHRLAHLYMSGTWPKNLIDHRDTDKSNNVWANLRPATSAENQRNRPAQKNNKLGCKNIRRKGRRYVVKLQKTYLGSSADLETAIAWRDFAVEFCHGEFARLT